MTRALARAERIRPPDRGEGTVRSPWCDGKPRRSVYLQPGQVHAAADPCELVTVVGSCVAVCLFDPAAAAGGMNHYLLPLAVERERSLRYGDHAMRVLLDEVVRAGASPQRLRAKVFGGASVIDAFCHRNLGADNVELALRFLEQHGIPAPDQDVGGRGGRKIIFQTDSGTAWVRHL